MDEGAVLPKDIAEWNQREDRETDQNQESAHTDLPERSIPNLRLTGRIGHG